MESKHGARLGYVASWEPLLETKNKKMDQKKKMNGIE